MESILCNNCLKRLPLGCFYSKIQHKNGKVYFNYYHVCKKCISVRRKLKNAQYIGASVQSVAVDEAELLTPSSKQRRDVSWIIRNLEKFGNCYVRKLTDIDLEYLEARVGFAILTRSTSKENDGYILEKRK